MSLPLFFFMEIYFTADTHAWHSNIIGYCQRPFVDSSEMTKVLADNINRVVPSCATLYHLGDFAWGQELRIRGFREMINCKNVHLILGNHDRVIRKQKKLHGLFVSVSDIKQIVAGKTKIILCHYAMRVWNARCHGSWHLYGHSHGTLPEDPHSLSFDVGVDCWGYGPVSFEQVFCKMKEKSVGLKQ